MISVRMHQRGGELLLAAADKAIGRKFSEGLCVWMCASFYEERMPVRPCSSTG